jgi:glycerophosphoryl diester phosphodiesterase
VGIAITLAPRDVQPAATVATPRRAMIFAARVVTRSGAVAGEDSSVAYFDGARPRLFGHRGAAALLPENTLPSFELAVRDGARYLELDVHASGEGEIVVIHDATVDRTTDGAGAVRLMSLVSLRRLDAGYRFVGRDGGYPARGRGIAIPTLREVLAAFPTVPLNIEIKQETPSIVATVIDVIARAGATARVLLAAERDAVMATLRPACAPHGIPTGFAAGEVADFIGRVAGGRLDGYEPPGRALQVPPSWEGVTIISAATVAAAHARGVEVHAWTINEREEMVALLTLGVDGIMSDIPGLARAVIDGGAGSG